MSTRLGHFASLRWKLVLSYVGVTLATILTLEALFLLAIALFGPGLDRALASEALRAEAGQLVDLAAVPWGDNDVAQLTPILYRPIGLMLDLQFDAEESGPRQTVRVAIAPDGRIVASNRPDLYAPGGLLADVGWPGAGALAEQALSQVETILRSDPEGETLAVAAPVQAASGRLLGVLVVIQQSPTFAGLTPAKVFGPLVLTTAALLPVIVPLGLVFGLATSGSLTHRLQRLARASHALAQGDLTQRVDDKSADEIGQLSRQFNHMAVEIESQTMRLHELADRNARLAEHAQRAATLEERNRLARDLHDGVKQNLFGVNLALATAMHLLETDPQAARARLAEAREYSQQGQAELQTMLHELRPAGLGDDGLAAALERFASGFEQRHDLAITRTLEPAPTLPLGHAEALYRIAQEALTNVVRHAAARTVTLTLSATDGDCRLTIIDDGVGFDVNRIDTDRMFGLRGMRERLAGIGGDLAIESQPGRGTTISATVPLGDRTPEGGQDV